MVFGSFGGKHKAYKTDYGQKLVGKAKKGVKALGTALVVGGGVYMAAQHAKDRAEDKIDAALLLGDEIKDIGEKSVDKAKKNPLQAKGAIEGGVKEAELLARTAQVAGVEATAGNVRFQREVRGGGRREKLDDRVVKPRLADPGFEDVRSGRNVGGGKAAGSRDLAKEGGGAFDNRVCDRNYPGLKNHFQRKACKEQGRPQKKKKKGRFR
tara:strand:- start:141 stop:770 length:630 start_codon:yes stop_codon:yes gene_type:complete